MPASPRGAHRKALSEVGHVGSQPVARWKCALSHNLVLRWLLLATMRDGTDLAGECSHSHVLWMT